MTLDDLIERLQEIRRECPASALATVGGVDNLADIRYERGVVWLIDDEDDGFTDEYGR